MASIKDFEDKAKELHDHELTRIRDGIIDALSWDFFKEEYKDMGLGIIRTILENEIVERKARRKED